MTSTPVPIFILLFFSLLSSLCLFLFLHSSPSSSPLLYSYFCFHLTSSHFFFFYSHFPALFRLSKCLYSTLCFVPPTTHFSSSPLFPSSQLSLAPLYCPLVFFPISSCLLLSASSCFFTSPLQPLSLLFLLLFPESITYFTPFPCLLSCYSFLIA